MTRRALGGFGAAVLLALLALGFAPQAALARAPMVGLSSPADGASLAQPASVAGQATMQNGRVDWVRVSIESTQGHPVPATKQFDGPGNNNPLPFTWSPPLSYNGTYKVTAQAQGTDNIDINGPELSSVTNTFTLNVGPATPTGVKATPNQTKRTVTITWTKNSEPDLIGYGVYRETGGELVGRGFIADDKPATLTDELGDLPAGTYTYHVLAARLDASGENALASGPGKASAKITSDPPPPPTTTTAKGAPAATTTTAPGSKSPTLATHGKADLSGFAALLPSGGAKLPTVRSTPAPDAGFDELLPFDPNAPTTTTETPSQDDSEQALGGESLASSNDDQPSGLRFMAAGLLVTVVLMHLLWLRDEVNREPLPAVQPGEPVEPVED
jgi:hypothetical protein